MLDMFLDEFFSAVPLQIPDLVNQRYLKSKEYHDDFVVLRFAFVCMYTMAQVIRKLEEAPGVKLLYHHLPAGQIAFGESCCVFSNPLFGKMYKINASTSGNGMVSALTVTVYASLEVMTNDLILERRKMAASGVFKFKMTEADLRQCLC